jgi:hypothetical protein
MWKNTVERGRPHVAIWRMCIACWIAKATDTNSEYVMLIAFHGNSGYRKALWCCVVLCCVVLCCVVWCGAVWCGAVLCCVVLCGVVLCGVVLCGVVLCGVVLC